MASSGFYSVAQEVVNGRKEVVSPCPVATAQPGRSTSTPPKRRRRGTAHNAPTSLAMPQWGLHPPAVRVFGAFRPMSAASNGEPWLVGGAFHRQLTFERRFEDSGKRERTLEELATPIILESRFSYRQANGKGSLMISHWQCWRR